MKELGLVQRITRLEKQNRFLQILLGLGLMLALLAAANPPGVIQATAFELLDTQGVVRAELAIREGAVALYVKDESGRDRLTAGHSADGTGLFLYDEAGTNRIGVAQFAHGGGGVALHGPESKGAAVLYLKEQGALRFFDINGKVTNQILATDPE